MLEKEDVEETTSHLRDRFRLSTISIAESEAQQNNMEISQPVIVCISDLAFKYAAKGEGHGDFKGEGHGDLQIDFMYYANTDLLVAFNCDQIVTHRYKYKFLRATTSNIPSSVIKDNRGSKLTIGRGGMLKVQHLVSVVRPSASHTHVDSAGYQQPSRIAYIEFFVKPEVDEDNAYDS